ncbi:VOC family protein [Phycicoccus avicenniae]|uniref:VOC family protein n=1 Tax=Phycicoccus avicenniae TaxID=2828860 RepID=UPI003D2A94AA
MSAESPPSATFRLDVVVLDCPDPAALASFYAGLLGWQVQDGSDDSWTTIVPAGTPADAPAGSVPALAFQRADDFEAPTWPTGGHPQQFHLDLLVDDLAAGEQGVLAAGAVRHDHQPSEDGGFVVYLDPAGHPFCLVR